VSSNTVAPADNLRDAIQRHHSFLHALPSTTSALLEVGDKVPWCDQRRRVGSLLPTCSSSTPPACRRWPSSCTSRNVDPGCPGSWSTPGNHQSSRPVAVTVRYMPSIRSARLVRFARAGHLPTRCAWWACPRERHCSELRRWSKPEHNCPLRTAVVPCCPLLRAPGMPQGLGPVLGRGGTVTR
jgi:hypothetical protein